MLGGATMASYASADHPLVKAIEWDPARGAERINDFILMSRGTSNGYLVASAAGDVVINTGTPDQGARYRERYEELLGRPLKVAKIILTQDHFDHIGGWGRFADPGAETIVQRAFPRLLQERAMLARFFRPRGEAVLHAIVPKPNPASPPAPSPPPRDPILFDETYAFEVGGRRFELYSAPSGETLDSVMVWLPAERILFTGNWMGALYGALPNFYTLRGDRDRSLPGFIGELERLIGLQPELLITGHDEPIAGAERIRADMTRLLEAVRYIHDETVRGMNDQKDLWTLMREIALPEHLAMTPGRGPVSWYVRAVYEEYAGWFKAESTTELYGVPPQSIWPELAGMAGGAEALAQQAERRLAAGEPLQALHFVEIALAADPANPAARRAEIAALEQLIDLTAGRTFDELGWLETKLAQAKAALTRARMRGRPGLTVGRQQEGGADHRRRGCEGAIHAMQPQRLSYRPHHEGVAEAADVAGRAEDAQGVAADRERRAGEQSLHEPGHQEIDRRAERRASESKHRCGMSIGEHYAAEHQEPNTQGREGEPADQRLKPGVRERR
jgi:glyoxylase-like metal-dependent hydrolase (beta-lactamase superfamily II)